MRYFVHDDGNRASDQELTRLATRCKSQNGDNRSLHLRRTAIIGDYSVAPVPKYLTCPNGLGRAFFLQPPTKRFFFAYFCLKNHKMGYL